MSFDPKVISKALCTPCPAMARASSRRIEVRSALGPLTRNTRLPTYGGLFPWGLEKDGREVKVRGEGQLVFNNLGLRLNSALAGLGVAYIPEDQVLPYLAEGRLIRVLEDWCPPFPGYHLYYPSRRHPSAAFTLFVEQLRYRS
jgi:DNA-binding transcriptional LysR family regulator